MHDLNTNIYLLAASSGKKRGGKRIASSDSNSKASEIENTNTKTRKCLLFKLLLRSVGKQSRNASISKAPSPQQSTVMSSNNEAVSRTLSSRMRRRSGRRMSTGALAIESLKQMFDKADLDVK